MLRALIGKILYTLSKSTFLQNVIHGSERSRVAILCGNQVLLAKSMISDQMWRLPGGGKHSGESIDQCAAREVYEELKISLKPENLQQIDKLSVSFGKSEYLAFFFKVKLDKKPTISLRYIEMLDAKWFDIDSLPNDTAPQHRQIVENIAQS